MPLPPPLKSLLLAARATADRALDPLLDLADATYVPPKPSLAPLDFIGIIHNTSTSEIEQITDPSTLQALSDLRVKVVDSSDGHRSMTITRKEIGLQLKPGMHTRSILDTMERNQARGYRIMLHGPD